MLWNAMTVREEGPDSDGSDGSSDLERRRSRSKRDNRTSWWPAFLRASSARLPKSSSRRGRRKDRNGCKPQTSRGWGLLVLGVLLFVYMLDFFNILQKSRQQATHYIRPHHISHHAPAAQHQIRPQPDRPPVQAPQPVSAPGAVVAPPVRSVGGVDRTASRSALTDTARAKPVSNLALNGNTGVLSLDAVKSHYRRLSQNYLSSFAGGIYRQLFFDVLRRRTYALTPPGANKGVQCILFQIINKKVYMMDPYEVPRNSKPFYRTRINEVIWILSKLAEHGRIRNTEFLMAIHDCVQTVNKPHGYRGAHYQESNPTFTIVSCNFSNNIPFPMWEGAERDGGFQGWDEHTAAYANDVTPWSNKDGKAVFRGSNRPSMYFRNKEDAERHCDGVGRTRLIYLAKSNPSLFDVSVGGRCGGLHHVLRRMTPNEHHKYKYIVYVEGNCMWADRLRHQVFGPSAIIKQETPCQQFFEPLLAPMTHYIPTDFFLTNTVRQLKWARQNDPQVQQIVRNANEFARNFLSRAGIEAYVEVLLEEYTKLLVEPDIKLEHGAVEVTNRRV